MARQPFNTRWAQGVETQDNENIYQSPGDIRLSSGWEGGQDKDAPRAGQENWWHNRVDSALQDVERKGAMAWHAQAVYGEGAPCYASDDYYYESIVGANSGNSPLSSTGYWRLIGRSLYSTFSVGEYKDVAHNGSPESGWLKCTGAVLLRTAYPKLFALIGTTYNTGGELSTQFRIPDWRGMFPRCLDDGRGIEQGRSLSNSPVPSQNLAHAHSASAVAGGAHTHTTTLPREYVPPLIDNGVNAVYGDQRSEGTGTISTSSSGSHTHTVSIASNGGTEARPISLAQVRWIRYL